LTLIPFGAMTPQVGAMTSGWDGRNVVAMRYYAERGNERNQSCRPGAA